MPTIATVAEASNEQITKNPTRSAFTFMPSIRAVFLPCEIVAKSFESRIDTANENKNTIPRTIESFKLAFVSEPVVQNII